jgi:hypothetical protein
MKLFYPLIFFLFFQITVDAQRFDGQWRGAFSDKSTSFIGFGGEQIDYVLELECRGTSVAGYSYTYYTERGRRYYTICKLRGTINKATKEVIITEFERTKYNTPPDIRNCFQTHRLRYSKDNDSLEVLEGTWIPAPNQTGDCGFGKTTLVRRLLMKMPLINDAKPYAAVPKKSQPFRDMNRLSEPPVSLKQKTTSQNKKPAVSQKKIPLTKNDNVAKNDKQIRNNIPLKNDSPSVDPNVKNERLVAPKIDFEKRFKSVLKTIEIQKDTFTVKVYDNGEIDGDSVSVFYNGSLLVSHKRLSDKPITLTLPFNKSIDVNELTMYAENLGTIPPNTALMVVTDGDKRYEVRISSDTEKNGTLAFTHKSK